jgi:mRNA-degrading endonuclease RelE of RelBE toxin-antitoxin system
VSGGIFHEKEQPLWAWKQESVMGSEHFDFKELVSIYSGLKELQSGRIGFEDRTVLTAKLIETWQTETFENQSAIRDRRIPIREESHRGINLLSFIRRRPQHSELLEEREQIVKRLRRVIAAKPSWLLGMSSEFLKAGQGIDPEPRRRILEAIGSMSRDPAKALGDMATPLAGKLEGLWCYRAEGYRVVYSPDTLNKRVALLTITTSQTP